MPDRHYKTDVVVAGAGLAGIATALELLDRGARVLLLDRDCEGNAGGLAKESFGGVFVVGSREQRRTGIRDGPDLALRDWLATGEIGSEETWPRRWAERYVHGCRDEVYGWLRARGVRFFPVVHWVERGHHAPGNSVPRFHMVWGTGERLVERLLHHLRGHPRSDRLVAAFGHRVRELRVAAGRVRGVTGTLEETGEDFEVDADATVIASGGICGSLERVREHWPSDSWGPPPGDLLNGSHPFADGSLHDEASRAGAAVTHLDRMWIYAAGVHHPRPRRPHHGLSLVPPKSALWVDRHGERLGPPPLISGFDTRWLVDEICRQPSRTTWQILNLRIARRELAISGAEYNDAIRGRRPLAFLRTVLLGNPGLVRELLETCKDFVAADTVPDLASRMNELEGDASVDPGVLAETVRSYDEAIARGAPFHDDDQLRRIAYLRRYRGDRVRTCKFQRIDDRRARPLIAIREFLLTRKSLGGIQTDLASRVLDGAGEPIPGLFAAGEAAGFGGGGIHGRRSLEGTFLGACILTGRIAARSIASGEDR